MTEAFLELPSDLEDGDQLADWAEALMFLEEREAITRGELKRRLAAKGGDFEVGLLLDRVRARRRRAVAYPFEEKPNSLVRRDDTDPTLYEFLLWASFPQSPVRLGHDYRAIDRFFDRIVLRALVACFGEEALGVRFGTPASNGRPAGFADALVWLADQMNVEPTGSLPPNDEKNDAGVDVIVWRPLSDARTDFVVAIAQCTFRDDWEDKAVELFAASESWGGGWLALGRPPVTFLAVPFAYSATASRFGELRGLINVILDRTRICELAEGVDPDDLDEITDWSAKMRDEMLSPKGAPKRPPKGS